jgi:hypothetical protein
VPSGTVLIFGIVHLIGQFRSPAIRPSFGEAAVALLAGLLAAGVAGVVGGIAAVFGCSRLLTGEMGEWALVLGPAAALFFAALAFVFTARWFLVDDDSSEAAQ